MDNLILLSIVSLINDFSSKMILPVLPLYIKQLGGAGLAVGLISGIGESIASFLKVLSGYWSDKYGGRKPFVLGGYFTSAVAKILFFFANSWPVVLVLRSLERTGKGLRSASRDALIAVTGGKRGKAFGIHRAFDSGGAVLGSLFVLFLVWRLKVEIRYVFLIAGIIAFFALIPIFPAKESDKKKAGNKKLIISFKEFSPRLKLFMAVAAIFALGNFSWMFLVLKVQDAFSAGFAIVIPILLYILYNVFYTAMAVPSGMLADKFGKDNVLLAGYSLFALIMLGFIFFNELASFIVLFILYGIMYAFIESNERAYVSDLSEDETRGTALGTFFTLTSIVALPAGLIAGSLYDVQPEFTFVYGLVLSMSAVALFLVHKCSRK
ncbi:MFS transporter [Candidatus Woesearchaeota archaeon]|nr:MFS transporter [Candidatus Woesearchaeota archaeon]